MDNLRNTALALMNFHKDIHINIKQATLSFLERCGRGGRDLTEEWSSLYESDVESKVDEWNNHKEAMWAEGDQDEHHFVVPENDEVEEEANNDWSYASLLDDDIDN